MESLELKQRLIKSLERGNLYEVTFQMNGIETKGFVSANPQHKILNYSDATLKSIFSKSIDLKNDVDNKEMVTNSNVNVKAMEKAIGKALNVGAIVQIDTCEGKGRFEMNGKKFPDIIQVMNELKTPNSVNKLIADFEKNNPSKEIVNEPKKS